ncbi:MAG: hypothetical protein ACP5QO_15075 [Clostridia bacterium]
MWTVVYIAPSRAAAERLKAVLEREGLLANLRPLDVDENGRGSVEVLVPEAEAEEAQEVLNDHLGGLK